MKNVKKVRWGLIALCAALSLVFVSCNQPEDETAKTTDPTTVTDPDVKTIDDSEITVNVGETVKVKVEGKTAAEFTETAGLSITHKGNGIFEITAAETMTDATVAVNFNDGTDTDDGINVTLYVYDPYYHLTLTLDDEVKAKAATISIKYGNNEKNDFETIEVPYTTNSQTASVNLKKSKANDYDWYNGIEVTVKDNDGQNVDVDVSPSYFCYSATSGDGFLDSDGIKVSFSPLFRDFTINFVGFTIPDGSISQMTIATEYDDEVDAPKWKAESAFTVTPVIAENGESATFKIDKEDLTSKKEFYINWTAIEVKDSDDNDITISSGNTDSKQWYSYGENNWSNTLTHVSGTYVNLINEVEFDADGSAYVQIIPASDFSSISVGTLKVVVVITSATEWWASASSAGSWASETYQELAWSDDVGGYTAVITAESFINALATNGFYLNLKEDAKGTVTVDYIAK